MNDAQQQRLQDDTDANVSDPATAFAAADDRLRRSEFTDALLWYRLAGSLEADAGHREDPRSLYGIAKCQVMLYRHEDAELTTKRLVDAAPYMPEAWTIRGTVLFLIGKFAEAEAAFIRGNVISPMPLNREWVQRCREKNSSAAAIASAAPPSDCKEAPASPVPATDSADASVWPRGTRAVSSSAVAPDRFLRIRYDFTWFQKDSQVVITFALPRVVDLKQDVELRHIEGSTYFLAVRSDDDQVHICLLPFRSGLTEVRKSLRRGVLRVIANKPNPARLPGLLRQTSTRESKTIFKSAVKLCCVGESDPALR